MQRPLSEVFYHLDIAHRSTTSEDQKEAIRSCFTALANCLSGKSRDAALVELNHALADARSSLRQRRALEFCTAMLFDKVGLPRAERSFPEFLWLFALPFTVTFAEQSLSLGPALDNALVDAEALLTFLGQSGYVHPHGILRASLRLLKREDLQVMGPRRIAELFYKAEVENHDPFEPIPLALDPELEGYRTVTFVVLTAARVPVGTTAVFDRERPWPGHALANVVKASLVARGAAIEHIESHPAHSIAEMLFRCEGPGGVELRANLTNAHTAYGPLEMSVRFPFDGYAEIVGKTSGGEHLVVVPPFSFFETEEEVLGLVEEHCTKVGLPFLGGMVSRQFRQSYGVH